MMTACNLNAIPADKRDAHLALAEEILAAVLETRELPDGYALRLPAETVFLQKAAAYIANERLCCPFFRFELILEPEEGPIWLHFKGEGDVKQFIAIEIMSRF